MRARVLVMSVIVMLCLGWVPGVETVGALAQATPVAMPEGTPCAPATDDEVRGIVDRYNAAFTAHDVDTLVTLMAPDVFRDDSREADESGTNEVEESFTRIFTAFPDLTAAVDLVLVDAPHAAVHYTSTGTQAVAFGDAELTGEPATWSGMFLVTVECGQIETIVSVLDQLAQQGAGTSTPATPVADAMAPPTICPELDDASAAALMDAWYGDAWTGNTEVLASITTPDVYHHWALGPDSSGQAAQLERVAATIAMTPGATTTYDALIVDGDLIAVHWSQTLGDDTWGGINIFRTECGLIDEVWSEMNIYDLPATDEATPAA